MVRVALYTVCVVAGVTIPNITLISGVRMPMISLGTSQFDDNTAEAAVKLALETGFNHIDTANNYRNQGGVGKALAQFDRSKYFITTKIPAQNTNSYFVWLLNGLKFYSIHSMANQNTLRLPSCWKKI